MLKRLIAPAIAAGFALSMLMPAPGADADDAGGNPDGQDKDEDGDRPSVALVYVDDIPHQLQHAAGEPDAGLYLYRARHHVGWDHEYYFYFEDGRGGVCRFPERGSFHGPIVTR